MRRLFYPMFDFVSVTFSFPTSHKKNFFMKINCGFNLKINQSIQTFFSVYMYMYDCIPVYFDT